MNSYIELISGFIGAAISVTVCSPLDVMRIRYQVQGQYKKTYLNYCHTLKKIAQQEGFRGFYRGYSIAVVSIPLFNAIYFSLYEKSKKVLSSETKNKTLNIALSCSFTGLICNVLLNPLWVLKVRMQTEIFNSSISNKACKTHLLKIATDIIKNEGIRSLFNGLTPGLIGILNGIIYFILYEHLKLSLHSQALLSSSMTILISTLISQRISVISNIMHIMLSS